MTNLGSCLDPAPSQLARTDFVACFGGIYERAPWVAEQVFDAGIDRTDDAPARLADRMQTVVNQTSAQRQMALIQAHPDLGTKAGQTEHLTPASQREQAGVGLDQCTQAEYAELQSLNSAYTARFGFPFIIAVKELTRADILAAMRDRLHHDATQEKDTALQEIHRIARFRLAAMARKI